MRKKKRLITESAQPRELDRFGNELIRVSAAASRATTWKTSSFSFHNFFWSLADHKAINWRHTNVCIYGEWDDVERRRERRMEVHEIWRTLWCAATKQFHNNLFKNNMLRAYRGRLGSLTDSFVAFYFVSECRKRRRWRWARASRSRAPHSLSLCRLDTHSEFATAFNSEVKSSSINQFFRFYIKHLSLPVALFSRYMYDCEEILDFRYLVHALGSSSVRRCCTILE